VVAMDVVGWLLDGDPAVRWQVLRDLTGAATTAVDVERQRVATEGWGARLLALQADNGQWGGGVYSPKWISTTYTLLLLRHLAPDPEAEAVRHAIAAVREQVTMAGMPFFGYRGETCITGMVAALGAYFLRDRETTGSVVEALLGEQLADGGWNCEAARIGSTRASFNTTISVLEGLLEYERTFGPDAAVTEARTRGVGYLLDRRLLRGLRNGEVVSPRWKRLSFPPRWHYDVLRGLDHLADARVPADPRWGEALDLVESKRTSDGRWPVQNRHAGKEHFSMEQTGKPSRWNTLRALRVLRWAGRQNAAPSQ